MDWEAIMRVRVFARVKMVEGTDKLKVSLEM